MRIYFVIKTNREDPMINGAVFQFGTDEPVYIDRDVTFYSSRDIGGGLYLTDMEWRLCYVWNGKDPDYFPSSVPKNVQPRLLRLELEEDAGEDYFVDVEEFSFDIECTWSEGDV